MTSRNTGNQQNPSPHQSGQGRQQKQQADVNPKDTQASEAGQGSVGGGNLSRDGQRVRSGSAGGQEGGSTNDPGDANSSGSAGSTRRDEPSGSGGSRR